MIYDYKQPDEDGPTTAEKDSCIYCGWFNDKHIDSATSPDKRKCPLVAKHQEDAIAEWQHGHDDGYNERGMEEMSSPYYIMGYEIGVSKRISEDRPRFTLKH